ncbi:Protein CLAVATA 3 [Hibiscus syriacus]|uniref:Protein CLAVATA 3 n=1 Tax=Hibiscus syriacus TaxID=106335 RepID=A0A6A2ZM99_HIBSY|nr:Protein CLAVATA 3 [Hibiscus syriacus]
MATRAFVLLLICFLVLHGVCGCVSGHGRSFEKPSQNRKMLLQKEDNGSTTGAGNRESFRTVPSGPDPLHHNGGSPKKPRTDP